LDEKVPLKATRHTRPVLTPARFRADCIEEELSALTFISRTPSRWPELWTAWVAVGSAT
jgi:hypothetical protein